MRQLLLSLFLLGSLCSSLAAPLSGVYSINSSKPTSSSNYSTLEDFFISLNDRRIMGNVYVTLENDEFLNSRIYQRGIPDMGANARVFLDGKGHKLSIDINEALLYLDGAEYFMFENIHFINSSNGTNARIVNIAGANHNEFTNCKFELNNVNESASVNSFVHLDDGHDNRFTLNQMFTNTGARGPAYGIREIGRYVQGDEDNGNYYYKNTIRNFRNGAFLILGGRCVSIANNDISRLDADTAMHMENMNVIELNSVMNGLSGIHVIGNVIHDIVSPNSVPGRLRNSVTAIRLLSGTGTGSEPIRISENTITGCRVRQNYYGINLDRCSNTEILKNVLSGHSSTDTVSAEPQYVNLIYLRRCESFSINENTLHNFRPLAGFFGITVYELDSGAFSRRIERNNVYENTFGYYSIAINCNRASGKWNAEPLKISGNRIFRNQSVNTCYLVWISRSGDVDLTDNLIDSNSFSQGAATMFYVEQSKNVKLLRNRITNNVCAASSTAFYGFYLESAQSADVYCNLIADNSGMKNCIMMYSRVVNTVINIVQNTFSFINNSLNVQSVTPFYSELSNYGLNFMGNIIDIRDVPVYIFRISSNTIAPPLFNHNSVYLKIFSNQTWTFGGTVYNSIYSFLDDIIDTGNLIPASGHFFDSKYASTWFYNLDCIQSSELGERDVYGNIRPAYSDRGAVEYSGSTRLNDARNAEQILSIRSNPSAGLFRIDNNGSENYSYEIYSIEGKLIGSGILSPGENTIDLSFESAGVYFIRHNSGAAALKFQKL